MNQQHPYGQGQQPYGQGDHPQSRPTEQAQWAEPAQPDHSAVPGHPAYSAPSAYSAAGAGYGPPLEKTRRTSPALPLVGWGATLVVALVAGGIAIWQVDERVYSPDAAAENYWNAMVAGEGAEVLGHLASLPEEDDANGSGDAGEAESRGTRPGGPVQFALAAEDEAPGQGPEDVGDRLPLGSTDSVLLDGEALRYSAGMIEGLEITEQPSSAAMSFTVEEDEYEAQVPLTRDGSVWLFFDDWKLSGDALTSVDLAVPGSEAGGIAQVDVNGEPVNLDAETTELAAFLPTVIDVEVDSDWLSGSARQVVTDSEEAYELELELEASDSAREQLHTEVADFLDQCAEQQVLMPSGCPMGAETVNEVDSETIEWDMPDVSDIDLTFGANGWEVSGASGLNATVEFDSLDHHDGEELQESHEESFSLDVQIGAADDELLVSVADPATVDSENDADDDGDDSDDGE